MQRVLSLVLIFVFFTIDLSTVLDGNFVTKVQAAAVTIDSTASTNGPAHVRGQPATVFIDDQTGYTFYRDGSGGGGTNGTCVYRKTTDGGSTWGTEVLVDGQTDCQTVLVWYDKWTPGDTGTYIHISTMDTSDDALWYNRLDTSSDTLLLGSSPVNITSGQGPLTISSASANHSLTKSTNGILYVSLSDNSDRFVLSCSSSCNSGVNWIEVGDGTFMDLDEDRTILLPLDDGDIMLINRDLNENDIRTKIWNGSTWSASWQTVDANALENSTYDIQMSAVRSPVTGDVYLAYIADGNNYTDADHDIRLAKYSSGSWSNLTDYITDFSGAITNIALSVDENTDDVYLMYSVRETINVNTTGNVYWASSTASMTSWGSEQGPINTSTGDIYGVNANYFSDQRLYVTWFDAVTDALYGEVVADVSPITVVGTEGVQISQVRASTSGLYLGGTFSIVENIASRNVSEIIVTENGTIDAAANLNNIKLFYDLDTSSPYDCVSESYSGLEAQFGSTDTNGFSGADGTSAFTGSVTITPTQAMCVYVVLDVTKQAADGATIEVEIANPVTDVLVSGGVTAVPDLAQSLDGTTNVIDSNLTQTHFHWRNDDGNELAATSRTSGIEDVSLPALQQETPRRLRFGISNEGSTTSLPTTLSLDYALNTGTCEASSPWVSVGDVGGDWDMSPSTFIVDGSDATDISISSGGVTNENSVFISSNGGLRDTSSTLGTLTFATNNWTEAEFSIVASTSATEGNDYCFRLSNNGEPLKTYSTYPQATIAADVKVSATGTQISITDIPTSDVYIGGAFIIDENDSSRDLTAITLTEVGTVDAEIGIDNVRLFYETDATLPQDCGSEVYDGTEPQFGVASTFDGPDGTATFSDVVGITTASSLCVYVVLDVAAGANNGEHIDIQIASPVSDVVVSGGSISPATIVDIQSSTTLRGGIVTQTAYHWRNDNGNETGATSATGGVENTPLEDFSRGNPIRLRIGLSNEGSTSSVPRRYGLEYGIKSSTCEAVSVWTDADGGGISWSMFNTPNLVNGANTTNIAEANGGVSDANSNFITSNGGVRDTESFSATTTLTENDYLDLEYSITSTINTPYEASFCFRVTQNGEPLLAYDVYPELTIESRRDFKIQRGTTTVTGTGVTLTAGIDYTAPLSSTTAFVRITNSHHTGAGNDLGGNQNSDDYTAYISNPGNIETSFTISRDTDSINNTFVAWEIIEYIGPVGGDNEIIVRDQAVISLSSSETSKTGLSVPDIEDDSDIAIFITGQLHNGGNRTESYAQQFTAEWLAGTDQVSVTRGATGGNDAEVSYAVIEFIGLNWKVQRVEHDYTQVGVTETAAITAVNSLSRTFLHVQKRYDNSISMADYGHEVWLSSIGAVSLVLEAVATTTGVTHTAVVWVIENTQTGTGEMSVQRSNGNTSGGPEPSIISVPISSPLAALNNSSIFMITSLDSSGNQFPRVLAGAYISSTTNYQIFRSDTGNTLAYRTEIVEWPAADLAIRQNYYRLYVNNDLLTPTDPWPAGPADLGEISPLGALDEPIAESQEIRLRMSARVVNATLPAGFLETKLQYSQRVTTCSAATVWNDVGDPGSGAIWRSVDSPSITDGVSLSTNPPDPGSLLLSVSDRAGRYTEVEPSVGNEFATFDGEDIEYDWIIEHNGASQRTTYCFRMVKTDDTPLDGYFHYPQIRTEGYTPVVNGWRWYDDELNLTPTTPLSAEEIVPTNVLKGNAVKLRVALKEVKNLPQVNARFKLQYAKNADFSDVLDVVATTSCVASSEWCYFDGAGNDNEVISSAILANSDSCVAGVGVGCGTRNESPTYLNGFTHNGGDTAEFEFSLLYTQVERNFGQVYYFRLYDLANDEVVTASTTNPSLAGESASLIFTVDGVPADTVIAGITTDATSTATIIDFGTLKLNDDREVAQQITVNTNATEGYQVYKYADQQLLNSNADQILPITSSNAVPQGWNTACAPTAVSCSGYHTTDATLAGPSSRFSPTDSYAPLTTSLSEIMHSSVPTVDVENIVYRVKVGSTQPVGDYTTTITYIAVPVF